MLQLSNRFLPNETECAAKVIDGEAVIINLSNGTYYSLDNAGAHIWELLSAGHTIGEVVESVTSHYDAARDRVQVDLEALLQELLAEKLVVTVDDETPRASGVPSSNGMRQEYNTPSLVTYRDMADLLALDPPLPRLEDVVWNEEESAAEPPDRTH